jgi:alkanesulfonate monooxygenase SsuD/methylene tetrahydromethanopterin reductase-like flavin-dependent oxidoreductase (luciferase family)
MFGMDYHRPLEFGLSLVPNAAEVDQVRTAVAAAEASGLDLVGIQDHPYQRRFLDTFALIGDLLARTERLRFSPDVASLPLRHPAMLAKQAASLDVLSGGRFELGLGAGSFWDAIAAMGGPRRSPGEAVEALEEAIGIIRQALGMETSVRLRGEHYTVDGYRPGPEPAHQIEIWVGAYGPRMLRLIGRLADGWVPSLGPAGLDGIRRGQETIDDAARAAGRDPAAIRRLLNFGGRIDGVGGTYDAAGGQAVGSLRGEGLGGDVAEWVDRLAGWATDLGIDSFVFWPEGRSVSQVETFGQVVAPAVRAEVWRRRETRS